MAKLNDLTGKTFGNWVVLRRVGSTKNKAVIWRCKCTLCGSEHDVIGYSLTSGHSTKCRACVPRQTLKKPHTRTRLYNIYTAMKQRCYNPNTNRYSIYGGRGITVCDEWKNNPDTFFEWSLLNGYDGSKSIDRIDNNKGYSPDNCRWVATEKQSSNRRSNITIEYNRNTMTLADACRASGVNYDSVRSYKSKHDVTYQEAFNHFAR